MEPRPMEENTRKERFGRLHRKAMRWMLRLALVGMLAVGPPANARGKDYQATKLLEVTAGELDFCFVVTLGDIGYIAVAHDRVPREMIVGDLINVRVKNDHIFVKKARTFYYDDDEVKATVKVRSRMVAGAKPPSCALAVTLH